MRFSKFFTDILPRLVFLRDEGIEGGVRRRPGRSGPVARSVHEDGKASVLAGRPRGLLEGAPGVHQAGLQAVFRGDPPAAARGIRPAGRAARVPAAQPVHHEKRQLQEYVTTRADRRQSFFLDSERQRRRSCCLYNDGFFFFCDHSFQ